MNILSIETSCDDTGITILEIKNNKFPPDQIKLRANLVSSQIEVHREWGGIVPHLAKREHQKNLIPVLKKSFQEANLKTEPFDFDSQKMKKVEEILEREEKLLADLRQFLQETGRPDIEFIAVTRGPGLPPALWTGVNLARALSYYWSIPLIGVNHLEGHLVAPWISNKNLPEELFPVIFTLVSGGHTQIIKARNFGDYKLLGETRDDAAGECFDKTARLLGLPYPGGPEISREAARWDQLSYQEKAVQPEEIKKIEFPRPMINSDDYDLSFSGLKTAVLYAHRQQKQEIIDHQYYVPKMASEIQKSIIDVIIKKSLKAARETNAQYIFLNGGVAANKLLREEFKEKARQEGFQLFVPPFQFCTDNAAMIGLAGFYHYLQEDRDSWSDLKVNSTLRL